MSGSRATGFRYHWSRTPGSTSGYSVPRSPFAQPKLRRDSRASFADGDEATVSFIYTRSSTSSVYTRSSMSSCLYQVINIFRLYQVINVLLFILGHQHHPFIPGHQAIPCLYRWKRAIHTSGRSVVGASWAGIMPTSGSWAVCVSGAWARAIHAYGMVLGSE